MDAVFVNVGCGLRAADSWINIDKSRGVIRNSLPVQSQSFDGPACCRSLTQLVAAKHHAVGRHKASAGVHSSRVPERFTWNKPRRC